MDRAVGLRRMNKARRLVALAWSLVLVTGCASLTATASPSPLDVLAQATSLPPFPVIWGEYPDWEADAQLTVEVGGLQDMEGLDLVGGLVYSSPDVSIMGNQPFALAIDSSPFVMSAGPLSIPSGQITLYVFAGEPRCAMGYIPGCSWTVVDGVGLTKEPAFGCKMEYVVQADENVHIIVEGLPDLVGVFPNYPACRVK